MWLFRRHEDKAAAPSAAYRAVSPAKQGGRYLITYEMMLKGARETRYGKPVRQYAIFVNGTITLVTSGDVVDADTYNALIAAKVIRSQALAPSSPRPTMAGLNPEFDPPEE